MIDRERLSAPMSGSGCGLELFRESFRQTLMKACAEDREIWDIYSNDFGPKGFDTSLDLYLSNPNTLTFVLFEGSELGGMSSFLGINQACKTLEIGGTYYRPQFRGTGFNRKIKQLMLDRAFGSGFERVEFRVDARNERSQAAMAKLGAKREAVFEKDRVTWTGHVRDTVLFSIAKSDWESPAKAGSNR